MFVSVEALINASTWVEHTHDVISQAEYLSKLMVDMETGQRGFMLTGNDSFLEPFNNGKLKFDEAVAAVTQLVSDNPAQVARFDQVKALKEKWLKNAGEYEINLKRRVDSGETNIVALKNVLEGRAEDGSAQSADHQSGKSIMDSTRTVIDQIIAAEQALLTIRSNDNQTTAAIAINVALWGTIASVLLGIIVIVVITSSLMKQLGAEPVLLKEISNKVRLGDLSVVFSQAVINKTGTLANAFYNMVENLKYKSDIVEKMADGDFSIEIKQASDVDALGCSLLTLRDSMNTVLLQVNAAVEQVASGGGQVSNSSQALSQGAAEQASSLEEISSSINEIASQSRQNAENADQANSLAKQATVNAENGNKQMQELVASMQKINVSSDAIKKVVKVIDDIAFQINLLALNANVEAARAGKYGKGFAVVADEVRNLAVKSATSVKETTSMVEESIRNIDVGNAAAAITAKQLEEIVSGASRVADLVEEIAAASKEQAQSINQINTGLEQVDSVTQSNTANAEESASAAEELSSQAQQLKAMVVKFKLADIHTTSASNNTNIVSQAMLQQLVQEQIRKMQSDEQKYRTKEAAKPTVTLPPAASRQKTAIHKPVVNPKEIINLEDNDFGKF